MIHQKSGKDGGGKLEVRLQLRRRGNTGDWQQRALLLCAQTKKEVLWKVVPCGCCIFLSGLLNSCSVTLADFCCHLLLLLLGSLASLSPKEIRGTFISKAREERH